MSQQQLAFCVNMKKLQEEPVDHHQEVTTESKERRVLETLFNVQLANIKRLRIVSIVQQTLELKLSVGLRNKKQLRKLKLEELRSKKRLKTKLMLKEKDHFQPNVTVRLGNLMACMIKLGNDESLLF